MWANNLMCRHMTPNQKGFEKIEGGARNAPLHPPPLNQVVHGAIVTICVHSPRLQLSAECCEKLERVRPATVSQVYVCWASLDFHFNYTTVTLNLPHYSLVSLLLLIMIIMSPAIDIERVLKYSYPFPFKYSNLQ